MFSVKKNSAKLETRSNKKSRKSLNNPWVKTAIIIKIRKYFQLNDNEIITHQMYEMP